eukprot:TRINITY_DN26996_c0_g1_i8.p1 TRINITY_DN26996_c0_g1~~TRINITY_DN26996_c0_g1_i8.p1  ORF type:complete len:483 (-),score=39.10 TRINITY_DN26996_c0_g1_i8:254-1702(-)
MTSVQRKRSQCENGALVLRIGLAVFVFMYAIAALARSRRSTSEGVVGSWMAHPFSMRAHPVCQSDRNPSDCGNGWKAVDGRCFKVFANSLTWEHAKTACEAASFELAVVRSEADNSAISAMCDDLYWASFHYRKDLTLHIVGPDDYLPEPFDEPEGQDLKKMKDANSNETDWSLFVADTPGCWIGMYYHFEGNPPHDTTKFMRAYGSAGGSADWKWCYDSGRDETYRNFYWYNSCVDGCAHGMEFDGPGALMVNSGQIEKASNEQGGYEFLLLSPVFGVCVMCSFTAFIAFFTAMADERSCATMDADSCHAMAGIFDGSCALAMLPCVCCHLGCGCVVAGGFMIPVVICMVMNFFYTTVMCCCFKQQRAPTSGLPPGWVQPPVYGQAPIVGQAVGVGGQTVVVGTPIVGQPVAGPVIVTAATANVTEVRKAEATAIGASTNPQNPALTTAVGATSPSAAAHAASPVAAAVPGAANPHDPTDE